MHPVVCAGLLPVLQSIQIGTLVISLITVLVERVIAVSAL
jgi:hypothetical protein